VITALLDRPDELRAADGVPLRADRDRRVRDVDRAVAAGLPAGLVSDAPAHLLAGDEIDVIVDLMGSDEPAHTLIGAALAMGKGVVTANKHVVAHHWPELEAIARRTGAALRFEAAVGGGIPVLGPLASDLAANVSSACADRQRHDKNFILGHDRRDRALGFAAALAGRSGSAMRADQSGIEGLDAVSKLVILARLAFDRWLDPATIPTRPDGADGPAGPGIATVSLADPEDAQRSGGSSGSSRPRRASPAPATGSGLRCC
jgi:homoserine dehydrogenase